MLAIGSRFNLYLPGIMRERKFWGSVALDIAVMESYSSYMNKCIAGALIQAAKRLEKRFEDALAEVDLSIAKYAALTALVQGEEAVSLSELAERLTCVRSNVTQLIDRLEAEGLARRTHDPLDRRSVRAEPTKLGIERQAVGEKIMTTIQDEVTRGLSAEERRTLERILENI